LFIIYFGYYFVAESSCNITFFIGLIIYLQNLVAKLLFFPEIEKNKARKMIILYFSVTLQHKIAFR